MTGSAAGRRAARSANISYIATFKALEPEDDAELPAQLVDLKHVLRLLLEELDG
jgi:hypothetical protein